MKRMVKKIARFVVNVFPSLGLNYRINHFTKKTWNTIDYNGIPFSKDADENINTFLTREERENPALVEKIKRDMVKVYLLYGLTPDEFFLHDCRHASKEYIDSLLSRQRKDQIILKTGVSIKDLKDKWTFYQMAKDFFKRDACRVDDEADIRDIEIFIKKHNRFIAKPRFASCGIGVHVIDLQKEPMTANSLLEHYQRLEDGKWMFEQFIEQDPSMAAWHPSSVNTIRIPSIRTKNGYKIILPLFRTGKNGNIVDNCHNDGGLMSVPDAETGTIITDGYDVFTNVVEVHPNSGIKFKGWQVPRWDELVKTSSALHMSLPIEHKYVGFDFALTPNGWVVVEGNWGNFPHQVCVGYGIRKEFERLMKS